jgi:hypothetical protein
VAFSCVDLGTVSGEVVVRDLHAVVGFVLLNASAVVLI